MATIRKRGNRYEAQIRKKGQPAFNKTFAKKADAQTWAKTIESEIERGLFLDTSEAEKTTVGSLIDRYEREVLPSKRSRQGVIYHLGQVKQGLGGVPLAKLLPSDLASYRDKRLTQVGPQSVLHELRLVQRILNTATKDWGIYLPHGNPVTQVRLPKLPKGRDRRLELEEEDKLLEAFENNLLMRSLVLFAVETGMRRGEISNMQWEHINWESNTLQIPETKTDTPRTIPLSGTAIELLKVAKQVLLTQLVCDPPPGQHH